eukprot:TRINITY_DN380_c0_g1_i4.p3 TRINITY_DN380_c0_g1~~TRINITY_DN380_c0_g1_i4.p3  ORF type:complete len:140 (+),score=4.35 TRINITY_DN380_c0_g1_i4:518-937(+)
MVSICLCRFLQRSPAVLRIAGPFLVQKISMPAAPRTLKLRILQLRARAPALRFRTETISVAEASMRAVPAPVRHLSTLLISSRRVRMRILMPMMIRLPPLLVPLVLLTMILSSALEVLPPATLAEGVFTLGRSSSCQSM